MDKEILIVLPYVLGGLAAVAAAYLGLRGVLARGKANDAEIIRRELREENKDMKAEVKELKIQNSQQLTLITELTKSNEQRQTLVEAAGKREALLMETTQKQQAEIADLKEQIVDLNGKVLRLERKLAVINKPAPGRAAKE